ncbi:Hypothetical protein LUCI_4969 [Lucifera butyrica]|uniref:Uncharacterized protein n=1 Tax=Lucifera butyrica TaxID=1351585 RepID=A0A498RDW2_9FIRM|nr:hypothetical protein [Lucifera butyrica]VBB09671.1 Hypothetical protein LUCI_4969 [Lucifera butyrica]
MKKYYTLELLEDLYRQQEPDLSERELREKARILHTQLNTLDISWTRSNRRFYSHNQLQAFRHLF